MLSGPVYAFFLPNVSPVSVAGIFRRQELELCLCSNSCPLKMLATETGETSGKKNPPEHGQTAWKIYNNHRIPAVYQESAVLAAQHMHSAQHATDCVAKAISIVVSLECPFSR